MTNVITAVVCILCFLPPKADKKEDPSLSRAIVEVQKLCLTLKKPDEATKSLIDKSGKLGGTFSCSIDPDRVDTNDDGSLSIDGKITVLYPDRDRYRTDDERKQIAELNGTINDYKREQDEEERAIRSQFVNRGDRDTKQHKARLKSSKKTNSSKIAAATAARNKLLKEVKELENERRLMVESLPCKIAIPRAIAERIDIEEFLKKKKIKMAGQVTDYRLGYEPREIGGHICVISVELQAEAVDKSVLGRKRSH